MKTTKHFKTAILTILSALILAYTATAQYILTDDDVDVLAGTIEACTCDFSITDIVIPDTLDGQTVTGIADKEYPKGVFQSKGITSVVLPSTIEIIGDYAFCLNSLTSLDFSACAALTSIGKGAFGDNSLTSLDLSACPALISIGEEAFYNNDLTSLDLSACAALISIEEGAFGDNSLTSLDLSACTALTYIGVAFIANSLVNFTLPVNTEYNVYGWKDGNGTLYSGGDIVSDFATLYYVPAPYTLTNNDVELTDGIIQSCSYNFELKDIIIPQTLDDQTVVGIADKVYPGNGIFEKNSITNVDLPSSLEIIGDAAFYNNALTNLDLSACAALTSIGVDAFYWNGLTSLDLSGCTALTSIGYGAFQVNGLTSLDLSGCTALTSIGENAFNDNSLTGFNLPTPNIPGYVLTHWIDGNSNTYAGGEAVSDLGTSYTAVLATTGYEVTFTVTDGTNTIAGAVVNLGIYGNAVSDASGIAFFSSVDPITDLTYIVTATGYANATSTITVVDSDVTENVVLMLTGIPDLSENHFNLYPNPAKDFVYLQLKEDALVSIINISGKMVVLQEVSKGHAAISTTYIKPGIYIFKVETENIVITKKIMIK